MIDSKAELRPKSLWNKFFLLILLQATLMSVCTQLFSSSTALFARELNSSPSQRALLLAAFPVAALIARLVIGNAIERNSRRSFIMTGLLIMIAASGGHILTGIVSVLILLRFIQGAGFSMCQTTASVAVADVVGRERLGEGLGFYQLALTLMTALMPNVAVYFAGKHNFTPIYGISTAALALSLLCIYFCTYEKRYPGLVPPPTTPASIAGDPGSGYRADKKLSHLWMYFEKRAVPCTMINIVYQIGGSVIINYLLLYANDTGISGAGLFFTLQASSIFIVRIFTSKFIDRYGSFKTFVPGTVSAMISFLLLLSIGRIPGLYYLAGVFFGIAQGLVAPSMNTAAIKCCPDSRRSIAASTYMLSNDVGIGAGGFIWSFVIAAFGYRAMFTSAIVCFVSALLLGTLFFKVKMKGAKI